MMRLRLGLLWAALLAAALVLAGCGLLGDGGGAADVVPTQTAVYVVITSTPTPGGTGEEAAVAETPAPDTPDTVDVTESTAEPAPTATSQAAGLLPTPLVCQAQVIQQDFENGAMFWVGGTVEERCSTDHDFTPGSGLIWVALFEGGRRDWLVYTDEWVEGVDPEDDASISAPAGLNQPRRGFGKVWREELDDEQRDALGWATTEELAFVTTYRYDVGGWFNDEGEFETAPGLHRLRAMDGDEFFFYEPGRAVFYAPTEAEG